MKKFMEEFKAFALRGNVLDMAVGVVVGGAFNAIVNSLVKDIINPTIGLFFNTDLSNLNWQVVEAAADGTGGVAIGFGSFCSAIINFLITAFSLFVVIKVANKAAAMRKKEEEAPAPEVPAEPTEKVCPYCCSTISIKATRCPHCTSVLAE